jgi:hypothetical protein
MRTIKTYSKGRPFIMRLSGIMGKIAAECRGGSFVTLAELIRRRNLTLRANPIICDSKQQRFASCAAVTLEISRKRL